MNKAVIINLSPRQKGTSYVLLDTCREYLIRFNHSVDYFNLYTNLDTMERIYSSIGLADTIIVSGPSYINCYPADTIALLTGILAHKEILHGQNLYGMIQGGMPYEHTHKSALRTLELFCEEAGLQYKGGFIMGMGAVLNGQTLDKLPNSKSVKKQLELFFNHIEKGEVSPDSVYQKVMIKMPGIMCSMMAGYMNSSINKRLKKKGFNPKQESPYLKA
jgi:hypothetical protein